MVLLFMALLLKLYFIFLKAHCTFFSFRKQMQLFQYLVRWMLGSFAPSFFKEDVTPLKIYTMLQMLIGWLFSVYGDYTKKFNPMLNRHTVKKKKTKKKGQGYMWMIDILISLPINLRPVWKL